MVSNVGREVPLHISGGELVHCGVVFGSLILSWCGNFRQEPSTHSSGPMLTSILAGGSRGYSRLTKRSLCVLL